MCYFYRGKMKNRLPVYVSPTKALVIMARRNLSHIDLAGKIGTTKEWTGRVLNGEVPASPKIRRNLLSALGCTFDDIFSFEDPTK